MPFPSDSIPCIDFEIFFTKKCIGMNGIAGSLYRFALLPIAQIQIKQNPLGVIPGLKLYE